MQRKSLTITAGLVVLLPILAYFAIGAYMADTLTVPKTEIPPPQVVVFAKDQDVTLTARDGKVSRTRWPSRHPPARESSSSTRWSAPSATRAS